MDSFELVKETVVFLNNYTFSSTKRAIVRRKTKKSKVEQSEEALQEHNQIWNATHQNDEEFLEETVDSLGNLLMQINGQSIILVLS